VFVIYTFIVPSSSDFTSFSLSYLTYTMHSTK